MASTAAMYVGNEINGFHGTYRTVEQLHRNIWRATETKTSQNVVIKSAPKYRFNNERSILTRFQSVHTLRRLLDEVEEPPLLVLEHLDSNLLDESGSATLESSEVKQVAKAVLQALAALHAEGIVHTDVKPDNILVNHGSNGARFSDVKLADCGDSTHVDSVEELHTIGAPIFRSPEAMLDLVWGTPTDIWSFGATLISLLIGKHWHIFMPLETDPDDPAYNVEVMKRIIQYFGPPPKSYKTLADPLRLEILTNICWASGKLRPFRLATTAEISTADRDFICKIMRLDPRDRPTAQALLLDPWLEEKEPARSPALDLEVP
ncbi:MAG: hypothetical protein LQ346_005423, partial [Caloplaca aetnensis]